MVWIFFILALILSKKTTAAIRKDSGNVTWVDDKNSPIPSRVEALLKTMTVQQKIAQTFATYLRTKTFVPATLSTGIGAVTYSQAFGYVTDDISDLIRKRNKLQEEYLNSTGGIPVSFINEGNHGGSSLGTIFPMPVGQGCSWNVSLVKSIARVIAAEASAVGVDTIFAPVVNMVTDPRFGRLQENFSENPILTSHLGKASVQGLQHSAASGTYLNSRAVAALGKHFAAYGDAAGGLNGSPSSASERMLFDVYLRPWRSMARAGMRALMPAHNTVLHVPCHANTWLLNTTMRQTLGFKGIMLSDCNDVGVLEYFRMAANQSHAAALALRAGVDWDLQCYPEPEKWAYNHLHEALEHGLITEKDIDAAVRRILTHKFEVGLFDGRAFVDEQGAAGVLDNVQHRTLAREAAEQSMVLLINRNQSLPIPLSGEAAPASIALLGPTASLKGCGCGNATESLVGSYALPGAHIVTLDEALAKALPDTTEIKWAAGCSGSGPTGSGRNETQIEEAVALAKTSDVAILVLGDIEGGCGEWADRDSLDLQGGQLALLEAVAPVAKKTIVILIHGRPQTFGKKNEVLNHVDAMFAAWRPGEEFGNAIVRLISGEVNPSAKLSHSWPRNVGHVGSGSVPWLQEIRGKWVSNSKGAVDEDGRRYDTYVSSDYDPTPLFYFGYGLSYATFKYEDMEITKSNDNDVILDVELTVSNRGGVDGVEIIQLYVQDPVGLPYAPFWKRLVAFTRCRVPAKSTVTCSASILTEDLALYDPNVHGKMRVYEGLYTISAGGSSNTDHLKKQIFLEEDKAPLYYNADFRFY